MTGAASPGVGWGLRVTMLFASLMLSGCANVVPDFDIPREASNAPTVATIKDRVVCELKEIATGADMDRFVANTNDVNVAIQLTLDVTDGGALAPSFEYLDTGFTFGGGFTLEQSRQQNFTEQLFFSMREIKQRAALASWQQGCARPADTNLSGRLGLPEAFALAMTSSADLNWTATGQTGVFGGSVTFIVKKDLSATGPTWTLKHLTGPGRLATVGRDHNDKLFFAFVKGKAADTNATAFQKARQLAVSQAVTRAEGVGFINNLITTQLAVSLNSISQALR